MTNSYELLSSAQLEIVRKIERFGAFYNLESGLSLEDQLLACEAVAESTPVESKRTDIKSEQELSVRGSSVSGACYSEVNPELISRYLEAIQELKLCKSDKTPPKEVAALIEKALGPSRKAGHWLYLCRRKNPRQIVWVLIQIFKEIQTGQTPVEKAADFFTFRLKKRKTKKQARKVSEQGGTP